VTDDADFRLLVALGPAKDEFLFRREFVAGENAGAVKTEDDGPGVLGEHASVEVAPDEEDGDFFRNAAAPAHNLLWQASGQMRDMGGPIKYLMARNERVRFRLELESSCEERNRRKARCGDLLLQKKAWV
jgi:hypothetical protein